VDDRSGPKDIRTLLGPGSPLVLTFKEALILVVGDLGGLILLSEALLRALTFFVPNIGQIHASYQAQKAARVLPY
jgi:hypothetical protein